MSPKSVRVNRAPVMTLWATVVPECLGFNRQESLTLGKVVTGLNAQSKGRHLGIYEPSQEKAEQARQRPPEDRFWIDILGRPVPACNTKAGLRAISKDQPVNPESVQHYLEKKFGDDLPAVWEAMQHLAQSFPPAELAGKAYGLYEKSRPEIPAGEKGWGQKVS